MNASAERIDAHEAHHHLESNPDTLLVCAYDSEEKFRQHHLEGAISLDELQSRLDSLPKDRELIFYCA
jgi:rhodanese-related sulfurtransferase